MEQQTPSEHEVIDSLLVESLEILNMYAANQTEDVTTRKATLTELVSVVGRNNNVSNEGIYTNKRSYEDIGVVESKGKKLIIVPEDFAITASLDDSTTLATRGLLSCVGSAYSIKDDDKLLFSLLHFRLLKDIEAIQEYTSTLPETAVILEQVMVMALPTRSVGYYEQVYLQDMKNKYPQISSAHKPTGHSEITPMGFIISNKGGLVIKSNLDNPYKIESSWKWKPNSTVVK